MRMATLLPLVYTYRTRLRNPRALLDWALRDVAIPLAPAIVLHGAPWMLALLLAAGFAALYEIGYFVNDRASSAAEPGGDRLAEAGGSERPGLVGFAAPRLLVYGAAVFGAARILGAGATWFYLGASLLVLGLLLLHTLASDRLRDARLFTFAALALFKYAPALVALVGFEEARGLLIAIFLTHGLARVLRYALRKIGRGLPPDEARSIDLAATVLGPLPATPLFLPEVARVPVAGWTGPGLVWSLYAGAAVLLLLVSLARGSRSSG